MLRRLPGEPRTLGCDRARLPELPKVPTQGICLKSYGVLVMVQGIFFF